MVTIPDDQAICTQCGNRDFAIATDSLASPQVTLVCLECGYEWNVNQSSEEESEEEPPENG